ncbi:translation initiation factor IF-2-like [Lynx rufus]|uniref:translation initiation factor IF-2-like n=1 Tax=Lynx rufus TaxID=61384 RepID=UPI001F126889|nr:translation initiation factor IF-2-like [Lynx rufus]
MEVLQPFLVFGDGSLSEIKVTVAGSSNPSRTRRGERPAPSGPAGSSDAGGVAHRGGLAHSRCLEPDARPAQAARLASPRLRRAGPPTRVPEAVHAGAPRPGRACQHLGEATPGLLRTARGQPEAPLAQHARGGARAAGLTVPAPRGGAPDPAPQAPPPPPPPVRLVPLGAAVGPASAAAAPGLERTRGGSRSPTGSGALGRRVWVERGDAAAPKSSPILRR